MSRFQGLQYHAELLRYVDQATAESSGLISSSPNSARFGVDSTKHYAISDQGRPSVRIEGIKSYTHGLFIADIAHMPGSICGLWPAFWTLGNGTWPNNGEIDIIEGVNTDTNNQFALHTSANCTFENTTGLGTLENADCAVPAGTTGCTVLAQGSSTYGDGFNAIGGGVYVMQWTSNFFKFWFFPRGSIPGSITSGEPDVNAFGEPQADYRGSCDIDTHFQEHHIIFDTTFCGDYAGTTFAQPDCPPGVNADPNETCPQYVAANPKAFKEA